MILGFRFGIVNLIRGGGGFQIASLRSQGQ